MSEQLLAAVLMSLVWAGCLVAIVWQGWMLPLRKAKAALLHLGRPLGFELETAGVSLWPASRDRFQWANTPMLEGSRGPYRVQVMVKPPVRWHAPMTWVVVSGPDVIGRQVIVSRQPEVMLFSKEALNPFARSRARPVPNAADLESFIGNARIYCNTAELERLLIEPVRAELLTLPRHWLTIGFDGSAMLLGWSDVETDPAIVERAFQIAMKSLQLLAERGATARGGLAPTGAHLGH